MNAWSACIEDVFAQACLFASRWWAGVLTSSLPRPPVPRIAGPPTTCPPTPHPPPTPQHISGGGPSRPDDDLPPENKLYVGSLPPSIDDAALQREFERFGPIASCRVIYDRDTNRPRGYAFVNFVDTEAARAALFNMNGFTGFEGGRPINVKISGQSGGPGGEEGGRGGNRMHGISVGDCC